MTVMKEQHIHLHQTNHHGNYITHTSRRCAWVL